MITSPGDERLITNASERLQGDITVRAKVWSEAETLNVYVRFHGHTATTQRVAGSKVWQMVVDASALAEGVYTLAVEAQFAGRQMATDEIRIVVGERAEPQRLRRDQDNVLEVWPEHGLLGTQLGQNKNGKKW